MNNNGTLDRIQLEIQESLEREQELRKKYESLKVYNNNNGETEHRTAEAPPQMANVVVKALTNGYTNGHRSPDLEPPKQAPPILPAATKKQMSAPAVWSNTGRVFLQNPNSTKGVMQKFLKTRGKLNMVTLNSTNQSVQQQQSWIPDAAFEPAKVTVEPGKHVRNGFVSADEKIRREMLDFQTRELELKKQRRQSQPDLMAALEAEQSPETNLKPARSTAMLYSSSEENLDDCFNSAPSSLRPAKSLAELCDAADESVESPGTHSLIQQFESLKTQARS